MLHIFNITNILTTYGYIGIFVIIFLESGIFFPLPGDSLIFAAGLLAATLHFNIVFLVFLIFLAAFLGGLAGYYIGTKLDFLYRYGFFRKAIKKEYLDNAGIFLKHHGLSSILLSRFIPVVRTFLPIVAGMARMKYADFLRYSFLGSVVWSAVFVLGGYFLGKSFPHIQNYLLYIIIIVVVISILPGVYHWLKHKRKKI